MHNYAGNPANFPTVPLVDDADLNPPTAAALDLTGQALADRTANLRAGSGVVTWQPSYVLSLLGTITPSCCAFDPIGLEWLIGGNDATPHLAVAIGRGDPLGWSAAGGAITTIASSTMQSICRGIEPAVANKYLYGGCIISSGGSIPSVLRVDTVGLAFNVTLLEGGITDATSVVMGSLSGVVFAIVGAASAGHVGIFHSTDHMVTQTSAGLSFSAPVATWLTAQSVPGGGTFMAIPAVAGGPGPSYFTSTDGITWTPHAGLSALLATETPSSLCYGTDGIGTACWILTTFDTAANQTNTYRSYDGVTWAAFTNNIPVGKALLALSAVGRQLIATLFESPRARILYSLDGGATWASTNLSIVGTSGAATAASNNQFLAVSNLMVAASTCYGSPGGIGAP